MQFPWFKRIGMLFVTASFAGVVILLAAIGYSVYSFVDIDSKSHSAGDTLVNFIFQVLIVTVLYTSIAYLTSKKEKT